MIKYLLEIIRERRLHSKLSDRFDGLQIEPGVIFKGDLDNFRIGSDGLIQSNTIIHLGGFEWCQNTGSLVIGKNAVISPNAIIYAAGPGGIEIGDHFDCGPAVGIFSSHSDLKLTGKHVFKKVKIGHKVKVFHNATISPGVSIGDNAVIAAGAVVVDDVPDASLVAGVPAKVIKSL